MDHRAKHVQETADEIFRSFVRDSMQYLRPEGGQRRLEVIITVDPSDSGWGHSTSICMVEDLGHGHKMTVLNTSFRDR